MLDLLANEAFWTLMPCVLLFALGVVVHAFRMYASSFFFGLMSLFWLMFSPLLVPFIMNLS